MSAQLETDLAIHGDGQTMIEKWLFGKRMFNFEFTVMWGPDLQRITFLDFKIFKIFQIFKTTSRYYLSNFCALISFQAEVLFLYQRIEVFEKHSGTSPFLVKILKKFLYTWRMTGKFNWLYQPNLVAIRGDFFFQDRKICVSILHYAIFLLL